MNRTTHATWMAMGGLLGSVCLLASQNLWAGPYADAVLNDNPVAYYRFAETSPGDVSLNSGLLGQLDEGNGTYSGGALLGEPSLVVGESSGSLKAAPGSGMQTEEFDKFSDVAGFGGTGFSVEFWTALEQTPSGFSNLVGDGVGGLNFNLMVYTGASGFIRPHMQTEELSYASLDSERLLAPGEVVHVVSTWDASSGDMLLYLDGEEAFTVNQVGTLPNDGTPANVFNPIYVGQDGREPSPRAWLDEVAIYNYPLTPSQIGNHYSLGQGAPSPLPEPPVPFPDPGNLPGLPAGLVTYVDFDESDGPGQGGALDFAYDRQGSNDGRFQGNAVRTTGLVGVGAASFDNTPGTAVALGPGVDNSFSTVDGITVEALIQTEWSGNAGDYDEIFRKEDGGNRILFSFQNDTNNGGANPPVDAGPVLSFGLNTGGYQELDMPLNVDLSELDGGLADSGTIWLLLPPDVTLGPNDVVLNDGATHHAVATYDAESGEKAIFIDGQKRWSFELDGIEIVSGGGATAYIGSVNGGENFTGVIDEFAFWDRALSAEEIAAHYANVIQGGNYFGVDALPGDYNRDGVVDTADIDLQAVAMTTPNENLATFDENGDGTINDADRIVWVQDHAKTWFGDANFDGVFSTDDLVAVFAAGKYETGNMAVWAEGDWTGDMVFDSGDLVAAFSDGGFELGPRGAVQAVPEPASAWLGLAAAGLFGLVRRRHG